MTKGKIKTSSDMQCKNIKIIRDNYINVDHTVKCIFLPPNALKMPTLNC